MIENVGLICEGGGTKAAYTSGVLTYFMEHGIDFGYSVGISAGAANLLCYLSKQPERLRYMAIDAACDKKSIGLRPLLKEGSFFGLNYVYDSVEEAYPLDYATFLQSPMKLDVGLYDFDKGGVVYVDKSFHDQQATVTKAACALAILCPPYAYRGGKYMDAGIIDMIPVEQSIRQGNKKHIFISTKELNFERKPASKIQQLVCKLRYPKHPSLVDNLKNRHISYAHQWGIVKELEDAGNLMVLRPSKDMGITRTTQDCDKLEAWFQLGYDDTAARIEEILAFCKP
ncbi:MAG: patatin-like phospholipase family protein [Erysipelotrichaceae bacterium]